MANLDDLRIEGALPRPRRRRPNPWPLLLWLAVLASGAWYFGRERAPAWLGRLTLPGPAAVVDVYTVTDATAGPAGSISAGGYLEVIPPGPMLASALVAGKAAKHRGRGGRARASRPGGGAA